MAKKPRPGVILNPDMYEDDDEPTGGGIPDADGWVYLKRQQPHGATKRAKKAKRKKRPR